ncbi:MAG: hypothetical protein HN742_36990 [Lentisphaerae bacterium]|jgi:hypothetical protein|nr:hypothetical protein [Lentisphaerota bacterium]MBT4821600.1 hypothetical protein [Lentisphaerota bacterium]MBT5611907.1 hypothetical protein [Lentisphaerota bacterium]MBT7055496.1 hypothetical protein [Lentisphaerota bacterium]MBT7847524.1 hypothetical protein [Lentisphaerota bacterium]
MKIICVRFGWTFAVLALAGGLAGAAPHIGYVYPGGGQQGTTFEVTIGGQDLRSAKTALFTGRGIKAKVLRYAAPLSESRFRAATRKMSEMGAMRREANTVMMGGGEEEGEEEAAPDQDRGERMHLKAAMMADKLETSMTLLGIDDPTPRGFARYRRIYMDPKRQPNLQISEVVTLEVTIAPEATPGTRELRLKAPSGVTNRIFFQVGQVREYSEHEPNDLKPDCDALACKVDDLELPNAEALPVLLNGQIKPGDVDRFRLEVEKGTRLVVSVYARRLVPYLADAVPGWFQATLALYDIDGNEIAYRDDFRIDPDPVIYYDIPHTGEYTLEVKDSIYRGREDFVYRILVGEVAYLTGIFPLGGQVGTKTALEVEGWNLPKKAVIVDGRDRSPGIVQVSVSSHGLQSNLLPFVLDTLPEQLEEEPNNGPGQASSVTLPTVVNGRIDRPGDWDVFRLDGQAGDEVVAEIQARSLNSPVDSLLKITDEEGKILDSNDDYLDKTGHLHRGPGLTTHHADALLYFKFPGDGPYFLHMGDTQHKGSRAHTYRLRISPRLPDVDLRATPSSITAGPGNTVPVTIHAVRKDGFSGDIMLSLKDAPRGLKMDGGRIPAGQDKVRVTLTIPSSYPAHTFRLAMEGRATIGGKEVCRPVEPADNTMQAFLWRHIVLTEEWVVNVGGGRRSLPPPEILAGEPIQITAGSNTQVRVKIPRGEPQDDVLVELSDPPKGITVAKVVSEESLVTFELQADAEKTTPGLKGNLIVSAYTEPVRKDKDGKELPKRRVSLGTLPAIPFEIAEK